MHDESLEAARQIDARCDEFEKALVGGQSPQIESFLTGLAEPARQELIVELLFMEIEFRSSRGNIPEVRDYEARFPS